RPKLLSRFSNPSLASQPFRAGYRRRTLAVAVELAAPGSAPQGPGGERKAAIRRRLLAPLESECKPASGGSAKIAPRLAQILYPSGVWAIDGGEKRAETPAMRIAL